MATGDITELTRFCDQCQIEKTIAEFAKNRKGRRGRKITCKDCINSECRRVARIGLPHVEGERACAECGKTQAIRDFPVNRKRQDFHELRCYECRIIPTRMVEARRMAKNGGCKRQSARRARLKTYGLTMADYDRMFVSQGGLCAICGNPEPSKNHSKRHDGMRELAVDHCHRSGKARQLLCTHCNHGLGAFKDNIQLLNIAIGYLIRHGS